MTRVGQILVILLTCFSLLFMGFAVTVFTTRTNWRDKYFVLKKDTEELQKKRDGLKQQVDVLTGDITRAVGTAKENSDLYVAQIKDQEKNYNALLANFQDANKKALSYAEQAKTYGDQARERSKENALLRDQLKTTREQREDALKKQFDTQQAYIELKGSFETLNSRATELEQRNGELRAILISRGISTDPKDAENAKGIAQNPPPVEGIIMEVDKEGKLVTLSIGTDDGLRRGHRLQVYRVKPQGKFVCTVEIVSADPDQSVARIIPTLKQGNPQAGDLVAAKIVASR